MSLICRPIANNLLRSLPKTFMAICDCAPESIASMRCEIGWPISTIAPGICPSLERSSRLTSLRLRLVRTYGASISDTLTPNECSSSSARPVLRATVRISGVSIIIRSASLPILSLSSSEIPGRVDTFIVKDPSLKGGKKPRPSVKNKAIAPTKRIATLIRSARLCLRTPVSDLL